MHSVLPVYEARLMSVFQPRSLVILAVLSLLLELWQGGRPVAAWSGSAAIAQAEREDRPASGRQDVRRRSDKKSQESDDESDDRTDDEADDDAEPERGEDPEQNPEEDPEKEDPEEEDPEEDEDPAKRASQLVSVIAQSEYSFLCQRGRKKTRFFVADKLSDLTHREAPERPPRAL